MISPPNPYAFCVIHHNLGILNRIFAKGMTALYDAIWIALEQIADKTRKTHLLVLTDGQDNSSKHTYEEVLAFLAGFSQISLDILQIGDQGTPAVEQYKKLYEMRGEYRLVSEPEFLMTVVSVFKVRYN